MDPMDLLFVSTEEDYFLRGIHFGIIRLENKILSIKVCYSMFKLFRLDF